MRRRAVRCMIAPGHRPKGDRSVTRPATSTGHRSRGAQPSRTPDHPHQAAVERPRLAVLLDGAREAALTLVAAAPGCGKTVALRQWAAGSPAGDLAWVTLDAATGDREALWSRIAAAVPARDRATGAADARGRVQAALDRRRRPLLVVLDDAHAVPDAVLAGVAEELLGHPAARLVLGTRVDPALPLHRLRLDGRLAEVRGRDLAFTVAEAAQLLAGDGVALAPADVELLVRRTEGWAAGLRLAALLLAGDPEPERAVRAFAGDDRAVVAYLVAEVLDRQPPAVREMLVRTSVLDRVSGPLADALTGGDGGQQMLEELVRRNAFVEPVDRRGQWFRYHGLFAELLRAQLALRGASAVAEQHRRAARRLLRTGAAAGALHHAVRGGDWALADAVLRDHGTALRASGDTGPLDDAVAELPAEALQRHPFAAVHVAARALDHDDAPRARALLASAAATSVALPGDRRRRLIAELALVRALAALRAGDVVDVRRHAGQAAHFAPGADRWSRVLCAAARVACGEALVADGDAAAERELRAAAEAARQAGLPQLVLRADALRAWGYALGGHLRQAELAAGRVLAGTAGAAEPAAHPPHALVAAARGRHDDATAALRRAAALSADGEHATRPTRLAVEVVRARLARRAAPDERQAVLSGLERCAEGCGAPARLRRLGLAARAELLTAAGRLGEAAKLLDATPDVAAELALARARVVLRAGHPGLALALADGVAGRPRTPPVPVTVGALATGALAAEEDGDRPGALRRLGRALDVAEPDGVRRPFLDDADALEPLLRHLLRHGTTHRALVGAVLDLRRPASPPAAAGAAPPADPLSERELAVLRYLPTMLTMQEIAGELFVTLNTIKSHLRSIYRKLGVGGRRDAVRRARELGLLGPESTAGRL
jgi:LuxR family maltose regulon positive regulatory protein